MDTCITCVRAPRSNLLCVGLVLGILYCVPGWGQRVESTPLQQLYLVSGTTTKHTPQSFPVLLYRVGKSKKLELVREVVPQSDGIGYVFAWGDAIFALHPHTMPTSVAIIHTGKPTLSDDVVFSSQFVSPSPVATTIAAPPGASLELLIPWITDMTDVSHIKGTLETVSSNFAGSGPRVHHETWSDYANMRREGAPGGPNDVSDIIGSAQDDNIVINVFGHPTVIDALPPGLHGMNGKIVPDIVAASEEYLILMLQSTWEEVRGGKLGESRKLFIHDRVADRWSTIQSEGNSPTMRLFGPWLATIVGNWSPDHAPNPGRDNERTETEATGRLPAVQILYRSFRGNTLFMPGILVLQNLADGRKIRIETRQEDSEILWVGADRVLYRVNDTIYQAGIIGDKLQESSIVVKDEDVPEIHWVFWSK